MAVDLYSACPCGSGKKFKWCCSSVWGPIEKAYESFSKGQVESAIAQMKTLQTTNSDNPEVFGRLAELLLLSGQPTQAEAELEKAFKLNSNYPFGYYLRAGLRIDEGEWEGALILLRKAAIYYHIDSKEDLARVYNLIFRCEMNRNKPLAAKVALQIAARHAPANTQLKEMLVNLSGPQSRLPKIIRNDIAFIPTEKLVDNPSFVESEDIRLGSLPDIFKKKIEENPADNGAKFNLAVAFAWLGMNKESSQALDEFIKKEKNDTLYRKAGVLQEVLKFAIGMDEESDYVNYHIGIPLSNPEPVSKWLSELQNTRRILPLHQDKENGTITFFLLEESASGLITTGVPTKEFSKVIGYLAIYPQTMVAWGYDSKKIENLKHEFITKLQIPINQIVSTTNTADFGSVLLPAAIVPLAAKDQEQAKKMASGQMEKYFEESWINQPRKSLLGNTPVDASVHPLLAKKLAGIIDFYEEILETQDSSLYDFNRLRHKLSLGENLAQLADLASKPVKNMNAAELASVDSEDMNLEQLEEAYRAAIALDAQELAYKFAKLMPSKGLLPGHGLFVSIIKYLAEKEIDNGNKPAMVELLNTAIAKLKSENLPEQTAELQIAKMKNFAKMNDIFQVIKVVDEILAKHLDNDKLLVAAAETMIKLNQKSEAKKVCEAGLKFAKAKNKGDLIEFFSDMLKSASK